MDLDLDLILKLGVGLVALWEVRKLRQEVREGFFEVASALRGHEGRLDDHERRIEAMEEEFPWNSS